MSFWRGSASAYFGDYAHGGSYLGMGSRRRKGMQTWGGTFLLYLIISHSQWRVYLYERLYAVIDSLGQIHELLPTLSIREMLVYSLI